MGLIRECDTGVRRSLSARFLLGRSARCDLLVEDPFVSTEHAVLQWRDKEWMLRDLGSRNGTYLAGQRLASGAHAPVRASDEIQLGSTRLVVEDDSGPGPMAWDVETSEVLAGRDSLLVLPSADLPVVTVYPGDEGAWLVESPSATAAAQDQQQIEVNARRFQLALPLGLSRSARETEEWEDADPPRAKAALAVRFVVSRDEEHVELEIRSGEDHVRRLPSRAHHYLLLTLARQRLADRRAGLVEASCGWLYVEELTRLLRIDESHLNVQIYRARQQLARSGIDGAAGAIERRSGSRQIRLAVSDIELSSV